MNPQKERQLKELAGRNPFWIVLIVFIALAWDYGMRISNQMQQRRQLTHTQSLYSQNADAIAQAQRLEPRLQALSLDLLQLAKTNAAASQIVREFNIEWNPAPTPALPAALASNSANQQLQASSNKPGGLPK